MLPNWYTDYKKLIETSIEKYLDTYLAIPMWIPLDDFKDIVKYAFSGGKKLRSILALEFYLTLSGRDFSDLKTDDDIIKLCIAIESVHAFSLVHDDMPCMDNDELRRGELTVWKKYGEYKAVLVGDMLNILCFELLSDIKDARISRELTKLISHSIGFYGMIGGQVEDMYFENKIEELSEEILSKLHYKKTGKLIEASILWGIIVSGEKWNIDTFKDLWRKLGLAFQIKDDLLDVEGTAEEVGKSIWDWEEKWFVYLCWVEKTREKLHILIEECKDIAKNLSSEKIDFLVEYVEKRRK